MIRATWVPYLAVCVSQTSCDLPNIMDISDTSSVGYLSALVADSFEDYDDPKHTSFPIGYSEPLNASSGSEFYVTGHASIPTQHTQWIYNDSISKTPGVIPYSSTINITNITLELTAPILSFAVPMLVNATRSPLALSVCYNDTVLPYDWLDPASGHLICIADARFVWGFSPSLAGIGLIFQILWFASLAIPRGCRRKKKNRDAKSVLSLDSTYRNIVNFAGAIEEALGDELGEYSSKEIEKALQNCGKLRWVKTQKHGTEQFMLSSVSDTEEPSSHITMTEETSNPDANRYRTSSIDGPYRFYWGRNIRGCG